MTKHVPGATENDRKTMNARLLLILGLWAFVACSTKVDATVLQCPDCAHISVTRVIDGDTFDSLSGRVRLFGVNSPERGQQCFGEATDRLRALARGSVRVEPGPRLQDSGGRLLFYAYTRSGSSIEEILIREGLAEAWRRDGQHRDHLVEVEQNARDNAVGCLW